MTRSNLTVDRWKTLNTIWRDLNAINWKRREREMYTVIFTYAFPKYTDNGGTVWEAKVSLEELQTGTGYKNITETGESIRKLEELGLIETVEAGKSKNSKSVFLVKHCLKPNETD